MGRFLANGDMIWGIQLMSWELTDHVYAGVVRDM
jgi:hypothetical protein